VALNHRLLPNPIPVAVEAVKEAGTFKLAFGPNTIPAGLRIKRLALAAPVTWMSPLIKEALPPVTRDKMFWMPGSLRKFAI
jgi:hypothetical protein